MVVANPVFSVPLMPLRLIRKHQWHLPKEDEDRLLPVRSCKVCALRLSRGSTQTNSLFELGLVHVRTATFFELILVHFTAWP